ncbi:hypothetical protein AGMMS49941_10030 [Deferribacterales bacterium]|nr:hypothetical protein AGMMS49941_10030 [Deferribacterales bacterium]
MVKAPTAGDFVQLQRYLRSENATTSAEAGLVLGYYYLCDKDIDRAGEFIRKYYNNPALTPYMATWGKLLMLELAIANKSKDDATLWGANLKGGVGNSASEQAFSTYCTLMRVRIDKTEHPYNCVVSRIEFLDKQLTSEISDVLASGSLKILVTGSSDMMEKTGGIRYFIQKHKLDYRLTISKEYKSGGWDYWIDMDTYRLKGKGVDISFSPAVSHYVEKIDKLIPINTCDTVIIGWGNDYQGEAKDLIRRLNMSGLADANGYDISETKVSKTVRDQLTRLKHNSFCAIAIGSERDIGNFVPTVRQYIELPKRQNIYVLEEVDTGEHLKLQQLPYYQNAYIIPVLEMTISQKSRDFANEYEIYSGKSPIADTFLGYDILQFIHSHSGEGVKSNEPSLSNVKAIVSGRAVRVPRMYSVDKNGNIKENKLNIGDDFYTSGGY